jgi:hypothetical protein
LTKVQQLFSASATLGLKTRKGREVRRLVLLALLFAAAPMSDPAWAQSPASETQEMNASDEIDDEAIAVLKNLSDHLADAKSFSYTYEAAYDSVQESGLKVEFGATRDIAVVRPNQLRSDTIRRDGERNTIIFNGETIFAISTENLVYASAEQPGDLDEAIAFAAEQLKLQTPAAAIVSANFYANVIQNLTRAYYLGVSTIMGEDCDHLLLSNDFTDFQLWVTRDAQPVPRRIVITYREVWGEPQFRAHFHSWQFDPELDDGLLDFQPPENFNRVRFYVDERPSLEIEAVGEDS